MIVNVNEIKSELSKYDSLIEKYEEIHLNLYNELNLVSSFWNDEHSNSFFDNINKEKSKIDNAIVEIKNIKRVYDYIVEKYQLIGDKISFDLSMKDVIIEKFNVYINKLISIINYYEGLDLSFCAYEASILNNEKEFLINSKDNALNLKEKIKGIFDSIEEIEKEVKLRISNLNIEIIKDADIKDII